MIEIDGIAIPLEPGKTYLLVVDRRHISFTLAEQLSGVLQDQFNIHVVIVACDDINAIKVVGPTPGMIEQP